MMNKLAKLVSAQKLVKKDILCLYTILGYKVPVDTKKESILRVLEENVTRDTKKVTNNVISLDMGLKNMALSLIEINRKGQLELSRWFKSDLEPNSEFQFNPVNYSMITCEFMDREILTYNKKKDDLTLVFERQRFRTGGASSVLESTLKTNTIEAMLCMGITLNNKMNNSNIQLQPSPPGAMVKYWQNHYIAENTMADTESKGFRVNLILSMLYDTLKEHKLQPIKYPELTNKLNIKSKFCLSRTIIDNLNNSLKSQEWVEGWNKAWSFKSDSRRLYEVGKLINSINPIGTKHTNWGVVKGDDLADSILHGITHFEYISNRRKLMEVIEAGSLIKSNFRM